MKKSILITGAVLITFSLMSVGFINWDGNKPIDKHTSSEKNIKKRINFLDIIKEPVEPELIYDIKSRFNYTVNKEKLFKAKTIVDLLPEDATREVVSYNLVLVTIVDYEKETPITGNDENLTPEQLQLIQGMKYSTNMYITAYCTKKNANNERLENHKIVYYMTITPEKEAEYIEGHESLIDYLKKNSKEETSIIERDQLKPGRVSFTVSKNGTIDKVTLNSSSGYPSVDENLIELISNTSQKWTPASNAKGEKVDQELYFFFGKAGC